MVSSEKNGIDYEKREIFPFNEVDNGSRKTPIVVATGFTTALLGDERTLREFIIGDAVKKDLEMQGKNAILYLINDSYDPLNYRQLRLGVNKDEKLLSRFEHYCGRPISEIPDPFDCHENYSMHFSQALLDRLHSLDIYPVLLDSYHAYRNGHYRDFVSITFNNYTKIKEMLSHRFKNYSMKNLFRLQCPQCFCLDATHIFTVQGRDIHFGCERCGKSNMRQPVEEIRGKLSWKPDCAARWNLYDIDIETFSKAHIAELGSSEISRFMSLHFYGGKVPVILPYGDVIFSRELSFKLLEILPPPLLKAIFSHNHTRDLILTKDYVETFCRKYPVRPGLSYVDYIRKELPKEAIHEKNHPWPDIAVRKNFLHRQDVCATVSTVLPPVQPAKTFPDKYTGSKESDGIKSGKWISDRFLVSYGNRFSMFYYGREYKIRLPEANDITSCDKSTAKKAQEIILHTLLVRNNNGSDGQDINEQIRCYLKSNRLSSEVYHYLRMVFGQTDGPNIATLLSILPRDYLSIVQLLLKYYTESDLATEYQTDYTKVIKEELFAHICASSLER